MDRISVEQLTALSSPRPLPIERDKTREQRNWVVRLAAELPAEPPPETLSVRLTDDAAVAIRRARAGRGLAEDGVDAHAPAVRLRIIDALHVVLNITTVRQDADEAHEYLVAASAALLGLEQESPIDDIQGIPRRYWRLLVGEPP